MSGSRAWASISSLGEGRDAHGPALGSQPLRVDASDWAPYPHHPLAPVVFDEQIPKKSDQRQMAACQRIGTYAAGLALQSAGLKAIPRALREWTWW